MVMMAFRDELLEYPTLKPGNRPKFRYLMGSILRAAYRAWGPQDDLEWARGFKRQFHTARHFKRAFEQDGLSAAQIAPNGTLPKDFPAVLWEFYKVNGLLNK